MVDKKALQLANVAGDILAMAAEFRSRDLGSKIRLECSLILAEDALGFLVLARAAVDREIALPGDTARHVLALAIANAPPDPEIELVGAITLLREVLDHRKRDGGIHGSGADAERWADRLLVRIDLVTDVLESRGVASPEVRQHARSLRHAAIASQGDQP